MASPSGNNCKATDRKRTIARLKEIQFGLRRTMANLQQNLALFDSKQPTVLLNLDDLKRDAELKANCLEVEVKRLREEVKSLKEFLGVSVEKEKLP